MKPRDYQERGIELAVNAAQTPASRLMLVSPTGTGKSVVAIGVQREVEGSVILTPSKEIIRGFKAKDPNCEIYTYVKYRNMLMDGHPLASLLIFDEGHRATESTSITTADILAITPDAPAVALTASPFRGTAKSTEHLRELWGEPVVLLSIRDAIERGYWQMPRLSVVPLLNDDQMEIRNGQFVISSVNDGTQSRLESLIKTIREWRCGPTIVTLPSTECVRAVEMIMGDEVCSIIQDTSDADRTAAYEACKSGEKILLQIFALSIGVDIPELRTLIDARPTLSPVNFLQLFGRLTRPFDYSKRYVCLNRNLERFAYLLEGMVPMSKIGESQEAFGGPSERMAYKTLGLEAVGRFKPIPVPLLGGATAASYMLQTLTPDRKLKEYLLLCLPNFQKPVIFSRLNSEAKWVDGLPERKWGRWVVENDLPDDFCGYKTSPARGELSEKQKAFWRRSAGHRGLDPEACDDMERRQFPILPALLDTKLSLKGIA